MALCKYLSLFMLLQVTGVVILAICIWTKVDQYKYLSLVMLLQVTSTVILAIGIWAKRARFRYLLLHGHAVAGDRYSDPGYRYLDQGGSVQVP